MQVFHFDGIGKNGHQASCAIVECPADEQGQEDEELRDEHTPDEEEYPNGEDVDDQGRKGSSTSHEEPTAASCTADSASFPVHHPRRTGKYYRGIVRGFEDRVHALYAVSYTHLTLPTIYSV